MLLASLCLLFLRDPVTPAAPPPPAEILGQWESAERTPEGVGNILEFRADGKVTQISVSMAEADFRIVGDRLITTWKDPATGRVSEVETGLDFEGVNRFLEKGDEATGDTWSERIGPAAPDAGSPLIGQWCSIFLETLPAYREFKGNRMYNRLPVVVLRGRFSVAGGVLTVTMQGQPSGTYPFRFENGLLVIQSRNGAEKKYRRPETSLLLGF